MRLTDDRFLTTAEVAQRYRTAPSTIRYWRYLGRGPKGEKYGRRTLYRESELIRWEQEKAQGWSTV
ncbi:helix-turn-helix domain-containing protein [Microbispora triticiradicis]|uniref:helix-turn-helix transcriptional regulator n=1 Tax=Microbispora triticiradicis TaxID=2200763 RepID=UPI0027DC6873|nr:helix-turn-helix domain-containing protein [Microbispora triticiradicis]